MSIGCYQFSKSCPLGLTQCLALWFKIFIYPEKRAFSSPEKQQALPIGLLSVW
jgi:hypothetical protein